MSAVIIISLIFHILSLKLFDNCAEYEKLTETIRTLEKLKLTTHKILALEKVTAEDMQVLQKTLKKVIQF